MRVRPACHFEILAPFIPLGEFDHLHCMVAGPRFNEHHAATDVVVILSGLCVIHEPI